MESPNPILNVDGTTLASGWPRHIIGAGKHLRYKLLRGGSVSRQTEHLENIGMETE